MTSVAFDILPASPRAERPSRPSGMRSEGGFAAMVEDAEVNTAPPAVKQQDDPAISQPSGAGQSTFALDLQDATAGENEASVAWNLAAATSNESVPGPNGSILTGIEAPSGPAAAPTVPNEPATGSDTIAPISGEQPGSVERTGETTWLPHEIGLIRAETDTVEAPAVETEPEAEAPAATPVAAPTSAPPAIAPIAPTALTAPAAPLAGAGPTSPGAPLPSAEPALPDAPHAGPELVPPATDAASRTAAPIAAAAASPEPAAAGTPQDAAGTPQDEVMATLKAAAPAAAERSNEAAAKASDNKPAQSAPAVPQAATADTQRPSARPQPTAEPALFQTDSDAGPDSLSRDIAIGLDAPRGRARPTHDPVLQLLPVPAHGASAAHAAVTQPAPVSAAQSVPVEALAVEIAAQARAGNSRFEIRLDPPELGRIDVRLDIDNDGNVKSRLIIERADTYDLLRRDQSTLERALQQAGLKTADNALEFSLRDQGFAQRRDGEDRQHGANTMLQDNEVPASEAASGYARLLGVRSGIDIRV